MLPKPVTAFALSALVSIASFTATPAAAAPTEATVSASQSSVKGGHTTKKKGAGKAHKKGQHLALHSAEPKESPHPASPKLAASMSTRLDMKKVSDKSSHASSPKKTTLAATGKETVIGGPTTHRSVASGAAGSHKAGAKVAISTSAPLHGVKTGAMAKSGRAPARPARHAGDIDDADDHPVVPVALRGAPVVTNAPPAPCFHESIEFVRGAESDRFPLTRCDGRMAPLAAERLSVMARPESAKAPVSVRELGTIKGVELAPGIRRLDPGLVERLQVIAEHFSKPGMPERIAIVSGYRPTSTGSFHASGQALDFHLEGVPNEAVVEFCKTLENTGCGYYPNSSFVHVDVRAPGTGHVAWIDASGPGEPPHYVASWPPPPDDIVKMAKEDVEANPYTDELPLLPGAPRVKEQVKESPAVINAPLKLKDWE